MTKKRKDAAMARLGMRRALSQTPKQREALARKAARARWGSVFRKRAKRKAKRKR